MTRTLDDAKNKDNSNGHTTVNQADNPLLIEATEKFLAEFGRMPEAEKTRILVSLESVSRMMNADQLDVAPLLSAQPLDGSQEQPAVAAQSRKDEAL